MLLPDPDSPTRPSASPRPTSSDTPSTALTVPCRAAICTCRSLTSSIGPAAGWADDDLVKDISLMTDPA